MPSTYDKIASTTFSSPSAGITFSSIPATYTDLRLVFSGRSNGYAAIRFNNASGAFYTNTGIRENSGNTQTSQTYLYAGFTTFGLGSGEPVLSTFDIMGYASENYKVCITKTSMDYNSSQVVAFRGIGAWRADTAPIDTITFSSGDGGSNLILGTLTLYGIRAA